MTVSKSNKALYRKSKLKLVPSYPQIGLFMTGNRRTIIFPAVVPATSALKARKILPSMWALAKLYPVKCLNGAERDLVRKSWKEVQTKVSKTAELKPFNSWKALAAQLAFFLGEFSDPQSKTPAQSCAIKNKIIFFKVFFLLCFLTRFLTFIVNPGRSN